MRHPENRRGAWTLALTLVVALAVPSAGLSAERYGDELSPATALRVAELLDEPEKYLDQRVKVVGLVQDVCPMKGCWLEVLDQQSAQTVRFKVEDDVIVFPVEAKGQEVVAEGILRARRLDEAAARRWYAHLAEERGEPFDPNTVTGPMTLYEIEGIGAEIGDHAASLD